MKKIISVTMIMMFVFAATGFVSLGKTVSTAKLVTKSGKVVVKNNVISLISSGTTYTLSGQIKELKKMNNKEVKITGYIIGKRMVVKSVMSIKSKTPVVTNPIIKPIKEPTTPSAVGLDPAVIIGVVTVNEIEGTHYELLSKNGTYVLTGLQSSEFAKYNGKTAKVTGKISESQISIYQRGVIFRVTSIEPASNTATIPFDDLSKTKVTIVDKTGIVVIDKVKGAPIALLVDDTYYGLSGKVAGLEKLNGKKVKITGYIPDIRYIRAPDFIMFEVTAYSEME